MDIRYKYLLDGSLMMDLLLDNNNPSIVNGSINGL